MTGQRLYPGWKFVVGFTSLYMACAIPVAIRDSAEFVIYSIEIIILAVFLAFLHQRFRLHLASLWSLSIWGLLHVSGGLVRVPESWNTLGDNVLYNLWLIPGLVKYDQAVHFYGFAVVTWVAWQVLQKVTAAPQPTLALLIISVATAMGLGSLNEVVEFLATVTLPVTNIGDYRNYGWDLVANSGGAICAALIIYACKRPPHKAVPYNEA